MATMTVSSKGQVVLPAEIRRRVGLMAGMQMEIIEELDGVRLVVSRPILICVFHDHSATDSTRILPLIPR